ncbi:MAG: hypothetical protein AB8B53_03235 [Flavobacteriales bacterium]
MKYVLSFISVLVVFMYSCKKDSTENPFDALVTVENTNPDLGSIPSTNFAYLHDKVFGATCANSGCHDGTFEPEFRSITSSYNSLVNQPVISNDEANSYTKRVTPGSTGESLLNARLTEFLPNTSGIMPLEVDEDSDWNQNSDNYISLIQQWINSGAPDMFGNLPGQGTSNFPPTVNGLVVFPAGNTTEPFERDPDEVALTPILVDAAPVDIWMLVEDDELDAQMLPVAEFKIAESISELDNTTSQPFTTSETLSALNFSDSPATFTHKITVDLSAYPSGTVLYLRAILNDGIQPENALIPSLNSSTVITSIFVLQTI